MYIPLQYSETDKTEIEKLIREYGFAILVSNKDTIPTATHIPLQLDTSHADGWILNGHVARANPQWKTFESNPTVLAIFSGPDAYISPSWYTEKNVPTWNYRAVHVYGKVTLVGEEELEIQLRQLMLHYENKHAEKPQEYSEIPPKTLAVDLRGVVGFKIMVERVEAVRKLSQNRDAESHQNIIVELNKSGSTNAKRIADDMHKLNTKK